MKDLSIAELLRVARIRAGLTQRQLAEKAGCSVVWVAEIERGVKNPSIPTLERLAKVLGYEIVYRMEEKKHETTDRDLPEDGGGYSTRQREEGF